VRVGTPADVGATAPIGVSLYASADGTLDPAADTFLGNITKTLRLKPGRSKDVKFGFQYPANLPDGDYQLLAQVDSGGAVAERDESNNVAASAAPVRIAKPFVDLVAAPVPGGATVLAGRKGAFTVSVTDAGNVPLKAPLTVALTAVPTAGGDPIPVGGFTKRLSLKPGRAKRLKLKFVAPATLPPGTYMLRLAFDPDNQIGDPNTADNGVDTGVTIQSGP
jgi:hypothetical protein